jgi:hypothetical protein
MLTLYSGPFFDLGSTRLGEHLNLDFCKVAMMKIRPIGRRQAWTPSSGKSGVQTLRG